MSSSPVLEGGHPMRYLALLLVLGCGGSSAVEPPVIPPENPPPVTPGIAASVAVVSGDGQRASVASELALPIVVRVTDAQNRPVPNQVVNFVVVSGGGSVFAGTSQTNASGESRERWTLGTTSGDQILEARAVDPATGDRLTFGRITATAEPGPAATLTLHDVPRRIFVGTTLDLGPLVSAADAYGNPVTAPLTVTATDPVRINGTVVSSEAETEASVDVAVGDVRETVPLSVYRDLRVLKGAGGSYVCIGKRTTDNSSPTLPRYESIFTVDSVTYTDPAFAGTFWTSETISYTDASGTTTTPTKGQIEFGQQRPDAFYVAATNGPDQETKWVRLMRAEPLGYAGGPYCRTQRDYVSFEPLTIEQESP